MAELFSHHRLNPYTLVCHEERRIHDELCAELADGHPVAILEKGRFLPHWMAICGFTEKGVYLYDPALKNVVKKEGFPSGNRFVPWDDVPGLWNIGSFWGLFLPQFLMITVRGR